VTFNTGPYYPSGPSNMNIIYTFNLWRPMNTSLYKIAYSLEEIYGEIASRLFDFMFKYDGQTTTAATVRLTSSTMNQVKSVRYRIMVIEESWGDFHDWEIYDDPIGSLSSGNPITYNSGFVNVINMTGTVKTFHLILGFDVRCGPTN
jgi:outer membrane lipoprotein-sorting protein